jgi:hypothetical protein
MTWVRRFLLAAGALTLAAAAQAQVALPGTDWMGGAQLKASISAPGQGSDKVAGPATLSLFFGPLAAEGLGANEFRVVLDDGSETLDFEGTYSTGARGRPILLPDAAEFEAGLRELIDEICSSTFDPGTCNTLNSLTLSVTRSDFKQQARSSKMGAQSIKSSGQIDFQFMDRGSVVVRVKLRFKSSGGGLQ